MSFKSARESITQDLKDIAAQGLYKTERILGSDQKSRITLADGREVINMCANNYLGLANNPELIQAAKDGLDKWGFGLASVRFICGTQSIHKQLEQAMSDFLGMEDTILYSSCFDANAGLFETILGEQDAIISDELNHASIIDGVRLCKAARYRYKNNDMADLRAKLVEAKQNNARRILIATDGVFSMDGTIAKLDQICDLADEYDAMVHHDDSHATGFMGKTGRGVHEVNRLLNIGSPNRFELSHFGFCKFFYLAISFFEAVKKFLRLCTEFYDLKVVLILQTVYAIDQRVLSGFELLACHTTGYIEHEHYILWDILCNEFLVVRSEREKEELLTFIAFPNHQICHTSLLGGIYEKEVIFIRLHTLLII